MMVYIGRRAISSLFVLIGVSIAVFMMIHLVPGNPAEVMEASDAGANIKVLEHQLGLDRPIYVQYWDYVDKVFHGDLGRSIFLGQTSSSLIMQRLPYTAELTFVALAIAIIGGIAAGVVAAIYSGRALDHVATVGAVAGLSIPAFWLGLMLILVFGVWLRWLPVAGASGVSSVVLPAVTLAAIPLALIALLTRSSLLEVLGEDYIRTARAKGLNGTQVIMRHALRNSVIPVVTVIGIQFGALLGGAFIVESVFAWPGIGQLLIQAVSERDFPLIQGIILFVSAAVVFVNLLADIAYAYIDPRITYT
jgi:ABC-type dipeptide/oligopeptide/nickel transport system permease component